MTELDQIAAVRPIAKQMIYRPNYFCMNLVSAILQVVGVMSMALGILLLCGSISAASDSSRAGLIMLLNPMTHIGLWVFIAGLVVSGLGSAISALRDIARNSFR